MAAAVSPAFGRGRGRGRGLRAASQQKPGPPPSTQSTGVPQNKPGPSPTINSENKEQRKVVSDNIKPDSEKVKTDYTIVKVIMKQMDDLTESEVMKIILPKIECIKDKDTLEDLVKELTAKALLDPSFAVTAAKLANKIWNNESLHSYIRNPLLKLTQMNYSNRAALRKENKFYALCVYICELFNHLRVKDKPLIPIGDAVIQLLKELIQTSEDPTDEDVFYFYQELESVGCLIEECFPEKMEGVINIARQMVISKTMLPSIRCRLVQLLELHAAKWQMDNDMKLKYDDLQQDLMSEGK